PLAPALAEEALEISPPPELADPPAAGLEHRAHLAQPAVGDDAIQRLAIHIHDPEDVREPRHDFLSQRLGHVALVELGVADDDAWWPPTFTPSGFGRRELA